MFIKSIPNEKDVHESTDRAVDGVLNKDEKLLFALANLERSKEGLPPMRLDMRLVGLARMKSEEMHKKRYFSHISPEYGTPLQMKRRYGIKARVMGAENIARAPSARRAHALFMGSEAHRNNIMDPRHNSVGIGVYHSGHGVIVTQLFLGQ